MLLREKDKLTLHNIFSTISLPVEIWAYGSRVNGTAHEGSDLDLVIRGKDLAPVPVSVWGSILDKIKESNIPILVELREWTNLPASFHVNIEKQYEVVFDNISLHRSNESN